MLMLMLVDTFCVLLLVNCAAGHDGSGLKRVLQLLDKIRREAHTVTSKNVDALLISFEGCLNSRFPLLPPQLMMMMSDDIS